MAHKPGNTRVLLRGESAGAITKADIERRARELALIRANSEDYTEEDLATAERQLLGGADVPAGTTEDAHAARSGTRDPAEPPARTDELARPERPPEENAEPERLATQGVEEAQHDQMVEDRRRHRSVDET